MSKLKRTKLSQEELDIFQHAMKDVKRLKHKKIKITSHPKQTNASKQPTQKISEVINHAQALAPVGGEEYIDYKKKDIANKILRNLRKGQYNVEAILDLHGKSVNQAKTALNRFLLRCLHDNIQVLLIIHGKGNPKQMPILKNKLNHWLREIDDVLAFCSASSRHGNRGALYVLLRKIVRTVRIK